MSLEPTSIILLRTEFALSIANHYLFVPMSIGLILLVAIMESIALLSRQDEWQRSARFWGRFFVLSWFMGFITGLPLRWQLTYNWSGFETYLKDILDQVLLLEAYIAPVMLGLIVLFHFGWRRLNTYLHCLVSWGLVALLSLQASAMLVLNGWMQHPVGAAFGPGKATITSLSAIFFNPMAIDKIAHALAAAIVTGCMFVFSIAAWHLLRKAHVVSAQRSLRLATSTGILACAFILYSGHSSTSHVAEFQPLKFAAIEGLWETASSPIPLTVFAIPDTTQEKNRYEVKIPYALSILMNKGDSHTTFGIRDLLQNPGAQHAIEQHSLTLEERRPNVPLLFFSYRIMVLCGVMLPLLFVLGLLYATGVLRKRSHLLFRIAAVSLPLPWIATLAGWIVAEAGRQPWVVYGVLPTKSAASSAPPYLSTPILIFIGIAYTVATLASLRVCLKYIQAGPASDNTLPLYSTVHKKDDHSFLDSPRCAGALSTTVAADRADA